jgi:hypothetical protein
MELSEKVAESNDKLNEEIGEIKEDNIKNVSLYNELSPASFKLSEKEIAKLKEEEEDEEEKKSTGPDEQNIEEPDEDVQDAKSMLQTDEAIMSRVNTLLKQSDKIAERSRKRDKKVMKELEEGKRQICIPATAM